MPSKRLLITARSFGRNDPKHVATLQDAGFTIVECRESPNTDRSCLEAVVADVESWVVSAFRIDDALLSRCNNLRLIIKHGIGVDNIDIPAATRRNIIVMNAPQVNPIPVADLTMTLLLAFTRRIVEAHLCVTSGDWAQFLGTGVHGKTLGIIGLGRIGLAVADRAKAFGMTLLGFDPYAGATVSAQRPDINVVDLEHLLRTSDFVSLNVPLSSETEGLIDDGALRLMKTEVVVVNTSRGRVVDEAAIYEALIEKRIAGYATDVFEREPPEGSPLLKLPNVLLTPHIGWYTRDAMKSLGDQVVDSILSVYRGETPDNILNREVLSAFPAGLWDET